MFSQISNTRPVKIKTESIGSEFKYLPLTKLNSIFSRDNSNCEKETTMQNDTSKVYGKIESTILNAAENNSYYTNCEKIKKSLIVSEEVNNDLKLQMCILERELKLIKEKQLKVEMENKKLTEKINTNKDIIVTVTRSTQTDEEDILSDDDFGFTCI